MRFAIWMESRDRRIYYHVTYYKNLRGIARRGLIKGARPNFTGRADLAAHSGKGLFLADEEVRHWINTLQEWAEHNSDNVKKDGLIPIVLRVKALPQFTTPDEYPGNPRGAWIYSKNIRSENLEMWDGTKWTPLDSAIDLNLFIEKDGYPGEGYWYNFKEYPYPPL